MATGKCVINDDIHALHGYLHTSDGIVLASPSYGLMPTARMKNFLMDRIGLFAVYTSGLAGEYSVGISTCGGMGAAKVARELAASYAVGFHRRAFVSGSLGVNLGHGRVESMPLMLEKAHRLGIRLATDIERRRAYPFQKLPERLLMRLVVRRIILANILTNREGLMKTVYDNLVDRRLIRPVAERRR